MEMTASTLPKVQHIIVKVSKEEEDKMPFEYTAVKGVLAIHDSELDGHWYRHFMERDHFVFAYRDKDTNKICEYSFTAVHRQYQTIESPFTGVVGLNVITVERGVFLT